MSGIKLCAVEDIPADGTAAFTAEVNGKPVAVLAARQGDQVYLYENSCPHIGAPLDAIPGEFLNDDGTHIECATHLALFRINDGYCTEGPCEGDSLTQINAEVRDASVYITP